MDVGYSFRVRKLSKFRVWLCIVAELISCQAAAARKGFAPSLVLPWILFAVIQIQFLLSQSRQFSSSLTL